jgi:hypothetical protein
MYIDAEMFFAIGLPLVLLIAASIQVRNKKIQMLEEILRHYKYFYKQKSDKEITEFIVSDYKDKGLHMKNRSVEQICYIWYNWNNFRVIRRDENFQPIEFDESKKQKSTSVFYPRNFNPVKINLRSFMTANSK